MTQLGEDHAAVTEARPDVAVSFAAPHRRSRDDLQRLQERMRAEHPDVDPCVVSRLVDEAWSASAGYRIQDFRGVLAERAVREQLRAVGHGVASRSVLGIRHR
jgi:hypothetical protein